jgi:hypothetical protein
MNKRLDIMISFKDTDTALKKFEEVANKHSAATEVGDYKVANKCYTVISTVVLFLRERNEIERLSQFLASSSIGVKSWAATYLLPVCEKEAIKALEEISYGDGIRSLAAETVLQEWRNGTLRI